MAELEQQLTELLAKGDRLAAIRLLREQRGLGLAQAKQALERFEAGDGLPSATLDNAATALPEQVRALAAAGHKLEAIKRLREHSGLGLAEAKRRVDQLGGGPAKPGCASVLLLALAGAALWAGA